MKLCGFDIGLDRPFFLIAGPCVLEGEQMAVDIASAMKEITDELGIPYLFKASYDKANRTSAHSFRGPGMDEGLRILAAVREKVGVPVLTDVHTEAEVPVVASVVDMLQTPAFLCRQTDFIRACAVSGKPVNIKKGQFLAIMRQTMAPVVFDATHSVQLPGGNGTCSGGQRQFVPVLARAAVAAGVSGLFMEAHPTPASAKSDGPNLVPLGRMRELLESLVEIDRLVKARPFLEDTING